MRAHDWELMFHRCFVDQLTKLEKAASQARERDIKASERNPNVKLLNAIAHLTLNVIPRDPASSDFRQGNTLGQAWRHWRRAKIGQRFRLFFRFDTRSRIIVYVWINDRQTLRSANSRSDPYVVFKRMLESGNPPSDWNSILSTSVSDWHNA